MKVEIIVFIAVSVILTTIPVANAQEIQIGSDAEQRSINVNINVDGDVHVTHVVSASNTPNQLKLIDGTVENLIMSDEAGNTQPVTRIAGSNNVLILPSISNSIIEYDLKDVLILKDDIFTWNFRYLETTNFFLPEGVGLFFVNDSAVYLGEKEGFACHGCQMILEYSLNQPSEMKRVSWEDQEFTVEIRTFKETENFMFDQSAKQIGFNIVGTDGQDGDSSDKFLTAVIPLELLWGPYVVFLDDQRIPHTEYTNNGTHAWVNMRPDTTGEVVIVGTTVIPEFPIIAPLAIGFLMILAIPWIRRVNLR